MFFKLILEKGLTLIEVADGYTPDDIIKCTGCHINVNMKNIYLFDCLRVLSCLDF